MFPDPKTFRLQYVPASTHISKDGYTLLGSAAQKINSNRWFAEDLAQALGVWEEYRAYFGRPSSLDKPTSQEWLDFLRQLNGPYGKVLLKAYQAKHGIKYKV